MTSVTYTLSGRTALVTLNRPERRNALDDVMIREITECFTAINRSTDSRVAVLTGSGSAFCAGMDLAYLQKFSQLSHEENLEDARNLMKMLRLLSSLRKPLIAMVNGPALGGGCGIAAAADFVLASDREAKLGAPEVRLGFLPAVILPFLIKRMGEGSAREFVLSGDVIDARAAMAKGLVTGIVPSDGLGETALGFAEKLSRMTSPSSVTLTKDLFARLHEMNEGDSLDYAVNLNAMARKTEDFRKGIESFIKKEPLEW